MNTKEEVMNKYLNAIAENIDISKEMREKAESKYREVGEWLGDCDVNSDIKIFPQGSFYLGTVIRPISDKDEYDIDLVCLLKNAKDKTEREIKHIVGDRIKEHPIYRSKLDEEGKRCWTLNYDEFHLDILPCVPSYPHYVEPILTEIKLTHKIGNDVYIPKLSNPYKYHEWFEDRMRIRVDEIRKVYASYENVEVEDVPLYRIKTPLQRAVQLLKRHRDIMYDGLPNNRKENAPISIIITTLAAHSYNNESDLYQTLCQVLMNMDNYIRNENGKYIIENPVIPAENFAEKWNESSDKAREFFEWLQCARREMLFEPMQAIGIQNIAEKLGKCYGKNVVQRALKEEGFAFKAARDSGKLYVNGLKGGLSTSSTNTTKKVGGHTFFGK